ncbi:MAG: Glu-tRNA(Gln) amidotransferase subunit GatE [archaeon]|jgi:glutamyl-tRNA(Gln) amidotransferase subunit E
MEFDYHALGLMAGLEVHQQLDTKKLFIRTPSKLEENTNFEIERKLRPVASELGEYDKSSLDAFTRKETFIYQGNVENISLIELDEEPPQPLDRDALKTVLEVALLCNSNCVNEAVVMRKTIIDGSNTSAFQRTMLVSIGGKIKIDSGKEINIETIALEEDAARPIKKEAGKIYYNLDRLGIPLIELATAPDIRTPEEAVETAKKIGEIMRLTCMTKRGKGTIRQDVNVSIKEGARCEIKGCQELDLLGEVVKKEIKRQIDLVNLKKELNEKLKPTQELFSETKEVTKAFVDTSCKFIKGTVFGIKLNNMIGYLGKTVGERRFGSELSDYAKATGVTGLLHRDELPNYGISTGELEKICKILECSEKDNFVIIVTNKDNATKVIDAVKERILVAFENIPQETRGAQEDSSSTYQRPISTAARMYPETDINKEIIDKKTLAQIEKNLPKSVEQREKAYAKLGLSSNHILEMKLNNYARFFEIIVAKGVNPTVAATLLLQTLKELKRNNINVEEISNVDIEELLLAEKKGKINKNNLQQSLIEISKGKSVSEIIDSQKNVDTNDVAKEVEKIVKANHDLIKAKSFGAIGPLMGDLMKISTLRGVDGKILSDLLKKEIGKVK